MSKKQISIVSLILLLFLLAAAISVSFIDQVSINYNISDYLAEDTDTKAALKINQEEFGLTTDVQVMISGIEKDKAKEIASDLSEIENVLTVRFDSESENHYKDGYALFLIMVDGDEYSEAAEAVIQDVKNLLEVDYGDNVSYGGTSVDRQNMKASITSEMGVILIASIALVIVILLIMAKSWLEPIVLLLASGVAVLLNLGSNAIFDNISYITNSIAAILQLALSVDYSIVLLHTYRSIRTDELGSYRSMLLSVKSVLKPVSASALTTIAGLLALLFMSFRIGFDIGIVLMKGIALSLITALTLFPALLLVFERLMNRTEKKALTLTGNSLCRLAFCAGKAIIPVFLVLLVLAGVLQGKMGYKFADSAGEASPIQVVFGQNSSVVLVYETGDDSLLEETKFIERISGMRKSDGDLVLKSYTGRSNTSEEIYSVEKAVSKLNLAEEDVELLYAMYALEQDPAAITMTAEEFLTFAKDALAENSDVEGLVAGGTEEMLGAILGIGELMDTENTPEMFIQALPSGFVDTTVMNQATVQQLYTLFFSLNGLNPENTILGRDFVSFVLLTAQTNAQMAAMIPAESLAGLGDMQLVDELLRDEQACNAETMSEKLDEALADVQSVEISSLNGDQISGIYVLYATENRQDLIQPVVARELVSFLTENMESNWLLQQKMTEGQRQKVWDAEKAIQQAEDLFQGYNYGRLLLSVSLPSEGEDTTAFVKEVSNVAEESFSGKAYLAGTIPSTYDLQAAFEYDNVLISVFTIVSIFVIVLLIFRSLSLPVVLVALIQGAIWLTLSILMLCGKEVFFMSYIVSTCILMGATIDYGILMSSSYVTARQNMERKEALVSAVAASMPTVFTSGLTLIIAGFIISAISSQGSISAVGLLLGVGTLASVTFITIVLPSLLYFLDKLILKLTVKNK